ncbi:MmcB family DNA repair protein [Flexibacterium corallicola]|uniref:MmcB family DNA repair protein n=1 Tax=Flexibacterium corallicola TaxID=3037259 RepID=UPI00286F6B14|nr:MmcB family DNA repair protein [Pseudovibrio sp. M1P-2-3]
MHDKGQTNIIQLDDRLQDGRQSQNALKIQRGTQRLLSVMGYSSVPEVTLPGGRRADLLVLGPKGQIWIIEIKSSLTDFTSDNKWESYREFCDQFYFASLPEVPSEVFPEDTGFILSDGYDAEIIREAPQHKLSAPRRKAITLVFAHSAAKSLHRLRDPKI